MLTLTNLSNADCDVAHILHGDADADALPAILQGLGLDGIEFMLCAPWDRTLFPPAYIKGVHLLFWPTWVDFWRGDRSALMAEFGSEDKVRGYYGSLNVADWVEGWRDNLRRAADCQPQYLVFHVAHNCTSEMYTRVFSVTDEEVIRAAIELVNAIAGEIPRGCKLLFENLWWPGLTFQKPQLAAELLECVRYPDTGFMLDMGHLMNTNLYLQSEAEGAAYVQKIYHELGEVGKYVYGIHLHQSLSGAYTREMMRRHVGWKTPLDWQTAMDYVMHVDQHQPFHTDAARRIVETVQPMYLVHEFQHRSHASLIQNVRIQRGALGSY